MSFELAQLVFDDPFHMTRQDRIEGGKLRWQTIGMVEHLLTLLLPILGVRRMVATNTSASFRRDVQANLKEKFMKKLSDTQRWELAALAGKTEGELDFSNVPATSEQDWQDAVRGKFYRPVKQQLTVRIDADVLAWLKKDGRGYQSRLNEILRSAMINNRHDH